MNFIPEYFINFLEPFKEELWYLLVACFVIYSLIFYLICWANTCLLKTRNRLISLGQSLSFFGTAFIQQESEYKPSSFGEALLSITWRVFAILMVATYTANLVGDNLANLIDRITIGKMATDLSHDLYFVSIS